MTQNVSTGSLLLLFDKRHKVMTNLHLEITDAFANTQSSNVSLKKNEEREINRETFFVFFFLGPQMV